MYIIPVAVGRVLDRLGKGSKGVIGLRRNKFGSSHGLVMILENRYRILR